MVRNKDDMEVALNNNTTAEILKELALKEKYSMLNSLYDANSEVIPSQYKKSKFILRAIAKNPNVPPDILKELFDYCPIEVLNNIALSLMILENPCFLEELCQNNSYLCEVFGMDNLPLFFQEWGINNNDILIRQSAALRIKSPLLLEKCSSDDDVNVRICVAMNKQAPGCILEKLAFDEHQEVRKAIASNPSTPKNILSILGQDTNINICSGVAGNTNTPEEVLESLAKKKSKDIRRMIAGNPNVNIKTLEILAQDKSEYVLEKVAIHEKTPPHVLRILASHNNYFVNQAIAANSKTPHDVLELL